MAADTAKRQLRAYLSLSSVTIEEIAEGFLLSAEIKNTGQTPAFNVRQMSESFSGYYPLSSQMPHPIPDVKHAAPIGAGEIFICAQRLFTEKPAQLLEQVSAGRLGFWIQGTVLYEDCFREPHSVKFRYVFAGKMAGMGGVLLQADAEGNEAD